MSTALAHKDEIMSHAQDYMEEQKQAGHKNVSMEQAVAHVVANEDDYDMSYGFDRQYSSDIADNPLFKEVLQTKYEELVDVNLYFTDREYYLMVFCASYEKYLEAVNIITVTLKNVGLVQEIGKEKKIGILTKLCNKATSVYG